MSDSFRYANCAVRRTHILRMKMMAAKTVIQTARFTPVFQNSTVKPQTTSSRGRVTAERMGQHELRFGDDPADCKSPHWNLRRVTRSDRRTCEGIIERQCKHSPVIPAWDEKK